MNAPNVSCAGCSKPVAADKTEKVGIEVDGQPEQIFELCRRCARRLARNAVRIERAQGLQGVLQA